MPLGGYVMYAYEIIDWGVKENYSWSAKQTEKKGLCDTQTDRKRKRDILKQNTKERTVSKIVRGSS